MKLKKGSGLIILIVGSLLAVLLAYFALESFLLAIAYGIAVALGILSLSKYSLKKDKLFHDIDSAYNFVNLMNIQMLTTKSTFEAYQSIENYLDVDFAGINSSDLIISLNEVAENYGLNAFRMYVNTFQIYENDGGNFKEMETIPTTLVQKTKIYYDQLSQRKFYKLVEITSLFLLWLCIIMFLKFSIPDYYSQMMENIVYQLIMLAILLAGSFLYYLAFKEFYKNKIRGM